jgi:hypothetical protein
VLSTFCQKTASVSWHFKNSSFDLAIPTFKKTLPCPFTEVEAHLRVPHYLWYSLRLHWSCRPAVAEASYFDSSLTQGRDESLTVTIRSSDKTHPVTTIR